MATQVPVRTVKISTVMRSAAFVRGFKEAHRGIPMDYDAYGELGQMFNRWNYERGRQFGFIYSDALKDGARVRDHAVMAWISARAEKWIC